LEVACEAVEVGLRELFGVVKSSPQPRVDLGGGFFVWSNNMEDAQAASSWIQHANKAEKVAK
jgi:hypothetical protein